ncbi:MAG: DUF302 domain-containing protein [Acidobacteria bacterium]|nr:DUF302 domain-containing protein [Acidobacteriota bacterium]
MLRIRSSKKMEEIFVSLRRAAERHRGSIPTAQSLGQLLRDRGIVGAGEVTLYTYFQAELYAVLLAADRRFAAFLPCRVAAYEEPDGVTLETLSPRDFCRLVERPDLEMVAASLERALQAVMEEAAQPAVAGAAARAAHGGWALGATETQVNMQGTVPQRIDSKGTKVEDSAGTGLHDAAGG